MLILRFRGGLGNQMFQYAFYRSAQKRGLEIKADTTAFESDDKRKFELNTFPNIKLDHMDNEEFNKIFSDYCNRNIVIKAINKCLPKTDIYFKERNEEKYDENVFKVNNKILDGYFQHEMYFSDIRNELLKELEFPDIKDEMFSDICKQIKNDCKSVSIHIRRGDYLALGSLYGGICTMDYYKKATEYISDLFGKAHYYVLSDDIGWTKDNICIENATYIDRNDYNQYDDWYDMYLMSICHHNIIANSSFSWWGAWLNKHEDKIVIRPQKWNSNSSMEGLCPKGWIRI